MAYVYDIKLNFSHLLAEVSLNCQKMKMMYRQNIRDI